MSDSSDVKKTLSNPGVHQGWEAKFRTSANEKFFERAFDDIAATLGVEDNATILDAGCGPCRHSLRLAARGFDVTAIDYSEYVIDQAKQQIRDSGYADKIQLQKDDILDLSFPDHSFDSVFCWGVLMHIPDIRQAISELSRVLQPGGRLVISEVNMHSLEIRAAERWRSLRASSSIETKLTEEGIETWADTESGKLLSRRVNVPWLIREFSQHGVELVQRSPGQFTEAYTRVTSTWINRLIHEFNFLWYRRVKLPGPACGNLLYFQKR